MRNVMFALIAMASAGACAGTPATKADEAWLPVCRNVGCIEDRLLEAPLPDGTGLGFSICRGAGRYSYQFELTESGWELTSIRSELTDNCSAEDRPLAPAQP